MQNRVDDIDFIEQLVKDRAGLTFNSNRLTAFRTTLSEFAKSKGVSIFELKAELERNDYWMQELLELLMIHETYFFRESECLQQVLARLTTEQATRNSRVRVWSAGCSTGEEAYTLSIMLSKSAFRERYEIIATDISNKALDIARKALYSPWSLRSLTAAEKESMFERCDRSYLLKDVSIKERVAFLQSNITLKGQLPPEWYQLDLIVCRNVLIYFDRDTVKKTAEVFFESLKDGGMILVGAADPLLTEHPGLETHSTSHGVIYKKATKNRTVHSLAPERLSLSLSPRVGQSANQIQVSTSKEAPAPPTVDLATALYAAGKWSEVIAMVEGEPERHLSILVRAMLNLRRTHEAVEIARTISRANPINLEALVYLTLGLMDLKEHQKALETAKQAIFLDRSCIYAHFLCGVASLSISDKRQCLKSMNNVLTLLSNLREQDEIQFLDNNEGKEQFKRTVKRYITLVEASSNMVAR